MSAVCVSPHDHLAEEETVQVAVITPKVEVIHDSAVVAVGAAIGTRI